VGLVTTLPPRGSFAMFCWPSDWSVAAASIRSWRDPAQATFPELPDHMPQSASGCWQLISACIKATRGHSALYLFEKAASQGYFGYGPNTPSSRPWQRGSDAGRRHQVIRASWSRWTDQCALSRAASSASTRSLTLRLGHRRSPHLTRQLLEHFSLFTFRNGVV
jgi:hypothetical protein